jgi:hypothetical protein
LELYVPEKDPKEEIEDTLTKLFVSKVKTKKEKVKTEIH